MQSVLEPQFLSNIIQILQRVEDDSNACKNELEKLYKEYAEEADHSSEKMLLSMMLNHLLKRFNSEWVHANIYENKYEISQIQIFNILIDKFPFVKFSQELVNSSIASTLSECEEATIIDIGIGQGTQVLNILSKIAKDSQLKKLVIIGIEPFQEALSIAEQRINTIKDTLPFSINFIGIPEYIECLEFENISGIIGKTIINASLALHHIQSKSQRSETIRKIKTLNPFSFYLIEPNVNHFEPELEKRIIHCFNHFYAIFKVIDRLDISLNDKNALKVFFGREMEDILGKSEKDRFEKHDHAKEWITMLENNHFNISSNQFHLPIQNSLGVEMTYHPDGFFGFTYENEVVLAVISAN